MRTNIISFALCDTERRSGCGFGICSKPNCCGACQRWVDDSGPEGVCLGIFKSALVNPDNSISLLYSGGDPIPSPPGSRVLYIHLTCDPTAWYPQPRKFIQPNPDGHIPNTPYIYYIVMATRAVCDPCTRNSTTCAPCASQSNCEWCLESRSCVSRNKCRQKSIRTPSDCPACRGSTCKQCLSNVTTQGDCQWCIGLGCAPGGPQCQRGKIVDPNFCPGNDVP